MYKHAIESALYNLSEHENQNRVLSELSQNKLYYQGLIVGIVSALMQSMSYDSAIQTIKDNLPDDCIPLKGCIPPYWNDDFKDYL